MLELLLCAAFTVLPDYLYRHYAQGKRLGVQITIYSVWYELRYGITACLMLTVLLISVIFYNHPTSNNVTSYFRTVPIVPEINGRVAEVYVKLGDTLEPGAKIFRLDSARQEAALEAARRRVVEVEATQLMARAELAASVGQVQQSKSAFDNANDELRTKLDLQNRNAGIVATRDIERLQKNVENMQGAVIAAQATRQAAETKLTTLIPAQKASAEAMVQQAQVDLDKTIISAGVKATLEQFALQVGDLVTPFRPAGLLIPVASGRNSLQAGFSQIEAQVIKPGMIAEATCISKPLTIIPMVVTRIQDVIAAGQFRNTEVLVDAQQVRAPGTILVFLEPLFEGGLTGVPPGSSCVANVYSNNHDLIASPQTGFFNKIFLHGVDAVGIVHAMILRIQALMLPIKLLVLGGH